MNIIDSSQLIPLLTPISLDINNFLTNYFDSGELDPISYKIIIDANIYNKPLIFILALTRLRFSDALDLFKSSAFLEQNVLLQMNKTKHFVNVDLSFIPYSLRFKLFQLNHIPEILDYHKIYSYLQIFKRNNLKDFNLDYNSNAHIFRHLNTCFLLAKEIDKKYISKSLGHLDNNAINSYFHQDLINYFLLHL